MGNILINKIQSTPSKAEFVSPIKGYWEITGVEYKGNIHTYRLYDKMTYPMNQDNLAEFSRIEKEKGNPHAVGLPQFLAICEAGVKSGDVNLMNYLHEEIRKYPNFLSRVTYNPLSFKDKIIQEHEVSLREKIKDYPDSSFKIIYSPSSLKDEIIHEYGMPDEYSLTGDIAGENDFVRDINNKESLELITGIGDFEKLDRIAYTINKTPVYLLRVNSKPSEVLKRSIELGATDDVVSLSTDGAPWYGSPAFRVLRVD
jgi:hypothetical protein